MIELSQEIRTLKESSLLRGVDLSWIDPQAIPVPYRDLLFHESDMTSTLARFHQSEICLKVLQQEEQGGSYRREVLLSAGEKPVEYGLIEVFLEHFDPSLRERVLGGSEPLGGILNERGVPYQSQPSGYFKIASELFQPDFFPATSGNFLFGRYNSLFDAESRLLARILEILPYDTPQN